MQRLPQPALSLLCGGELGEEVQRVSFRATQRADNIVLNEAAGAWQRLPFVLAVRAHHGLTASLCHGTVPLHQHVGQPEVSPG